MYVSKQITQVCVSLLTSFSSIIHSGKFVLDATVMVETELPVLWSLVFDDDDDGTFKTPFRRISPIRALRSAR
jgi:hypothetical protein